MTGRVLETVGTAPVSQLLGLYQAVVYNSNDPLQQNRVQLKVPQVLGTAVSNWAMPMSKLSTASVPLPGTVVYAAFLGGDRNTPVYAAQSWTDNDVGPSNVTVTGNLSVNGTSSFTGLATAHNGLTVASGAVNITTGNLNVSAGNLSVVSGIINADAGISLTGGMTGDTISLVKATSSSILTVQNNTSAPTSPLAQLTAHAAADSVLGIDVNADADNRLQIDSNGKMVWGSGAAVGDTNLYRNSGGILTTDTDFLFGGSAYQDVTWGSITSFTNGWTGTINRRLIATNIMALDVKLAPGGGAVFADGTQIATFGVKYTPATFKRVPMYADVLKTNAGAYEAACLYIGGAGQIEIYGVSTAASVLQGAAVIPLDV